MKHTPGTTQARPMARLVIALCLVLAFAVVPAVALAAPTTTSDAVASYNNAASIALKATPGAAEKYVETRYRFDGSALTTVAAYPATATVGISTYGAHTLDYYSVDVEGTEATQTVSFNVADTIVPLTFSNIRVQYLNVASISFIAADGLGGSGVAHIYSRIDGGPMSDGAGITVSTVGEHTLDFWAVDKAGNIEPKTSVPFEIIDSIAPVTTSDAKQNYTGGSALIHLSASDGTGGSGIDLSYYSLDDAAGFDSGNVIEVTGAGNHTLSFYSVDLASNTEEVKSVTFTIEAVAVATDTLAPVSTSNAADSATSPVSVTLTSSDEGGGSGMASLSYRIDGAAVVVVGTSTISAAALVTPDLGLPAGHQGGAAPTNCACHPGIIPVGHSAGTAPASCACHKIDTASDAVAMPESHEGRTAGCDGCHPAAGVIMPSSATNPNHYGQSAGFPDAGACESCHTFIVLDGNVPPASLSTTVIVGGVGEHTIEFWGTDVAGNIETPHKSVTFTIGSVVATYAITPSAGANGSISPATRQEVASGANATFAITPAAGYHVATLVVDGSPVTAATSYTFTDVSADHTISATFASTTPTKIATRVTLYANHSTAARGHSVYFWGYVIPNRTDGTKVQFLVRKSGSHAWTRVTLRSTFSGNKWSYSYHPRTAGTYYFKAATWATSHYAASISSYIRVIWR
jgi:hypothetical protein